MNQIVKKKYNKSDFKIIPHESFQYMWTSDDSKWTVGQNGTYFQAYKIERNKKGGFYRHKGNAEGESKLFQLINSH